MRILFLGNHTVGVRALQAILEEDQVVGVVAHPPDPEDGVRYLSVHDYARAQGLSVVRMAGRDPRLRHLAREAQPDLLWVTDYRYLLPQAVLSLAPLGAVNLHPSLLPRYRGRAPLNWAILNGERHLALTAHVVDEGPDCGDIIEQIRFELRADQDVGDALEILYPLYQQITRRVLHHFRTGQVPRRSQDERQATMFPRRRPEDGLIHWNQPAARVHNLIRAVTKPYPGAFTYCRKSKITIWKARPEPGLSTGTPGQVISAGPDPEFCVTCGDGLLRVLDFIAEPALDQGPSLSPSTFLAGMPRG